MIKIVRHDSYEVLYINVNHIVKAIINDDFCTLVMENGIGCDISAQDDGYDKVIHILDLLAGMFDQVNHAQNGGLVIPNLH
jgi:hypothetical protein